MARAAAQVTFHFFLHLKPCCWACYKSVPRFNFANLETITTLEATLLKSLNYTKTAMIVANCQQIVVSVSPMT